MTVTSQKVSISPMYIVLDDSKMDIAVTMSVLKVAGIQKNVHPFLRGYDAVQFLESLDPKTTGPIYIFSDIHMPEMDGWQFLEELKRIYKQKGLQPHVIMVSSSVESEHMRRALKCPFVENYVVKPLQPKDISRFVPIPLQMHKKHR